MQVERIQMDFGASKFQEEKMNYMSHKVKFRPEI